MLRDDAILQGLIEPTEEERKKFGLPSKPEKKSVKKPVKKIKDVLQTKKIEDVLSVGKDIPKEVKKEINF